MPRPGSTLRLALLLLAATVGPPGLSADQNVGCLYSERLCLEEEWCYDDYAFGRCLHAPGDVTEEDLFRFSLGREELHELSAELRRLFALGYRWSHAYTQCRLQAMLYANQHDLTFDQNSCTHLSDQDLEAALKVLEGQVPVDPQEIAIIRYTPSEDNPHAEFADEIYYPPADEQSREALRDKILQPNAVDLLDMQDPYAQYEVDKRAWIPQMHRRNLPQYFNEQYNTPGTFRQGMETRDLAFLPNLEPYDELPLDPNNYLSLEDMTDMYPIIKYLNDMRLSPKEIERFLSPENYNKLAQLLRQFKLAEERNREIIDNVLKKSHEDLDPQEQYQNDAMQESPVPDKFNPDWVPRDAVPFVDDFPESRIYIDEPESEPQDQEYGSGHPQGPEEIFRERKQQQPLQQSSNIFRELKAQQEHNNDNLGGQWSNIDPEPRIYTEGGVVYPPGAQDQSDMGEFAQEDITRLLEKYNLGFKRPERLDVKKPGPPFDTQIMEAVNKVIEKEEKGMFVPNMMKKAPRGVHPNPLHENAQETENQYVYVKFKDNLKTWRQGNDIINHISNLLHLEPTALADGHVDPHAIAFKVLPNSRNLNYTEVARRIDLIKDRLHELTGVEVVSSGIGDKSGMTMVMASKIDGDYTIFMISVILICVILVTLITGLVLVLLTKRYVDKCDKMHGLSKSDTEPSKDYQDLCRVRMAKPPAHITSISKEAEQSPSSRSSTSSWSEEPALHNMDISTGHMVLSYMEDHLKNKDRLEQEWVALCAYVAEPSESTIALKKDNVEKNRYKEVVPYDHARVVLNELSNANGSDYINASSITDHDPRNPAYIATQGPLPNTAPEFWQLIWEQGAVVIVMLTRLTENGAAMCHRYWPEEGSELYHIYEVHLVSEHIWCDDYLVRSFYLKNVRTGETRTVTQFHFLSWPEAAVPASTKALLEFRRKVNKSYRGRSCPIVVHCSDGAGRTGTYCLIDMVLSRMAKGAKEIDIAATLEHLRDQRPRMVATKQQFEFVLTAVAEEVHAILKALPPQPNPTPAPEKEK